MTTTVAAKHKRLLDLIGRRERWRDALESVRRLHTHVLAAERSCRVLRSKSRVCR